MVVPLGAEPEEGSGMVLGAEWLAAAPELVWRAGGLEGVIEDLGAQRPA
jgi:hypothetical protein